MVRHWFSVIAVLAVAVLMVATDASQSRERRLGRRARRNSGDQMATSPTWSGPYYYDAASGQFVLGSPEEGSMMSGAPSEGRRSLYPPYNQSMRALPVRLEVRIQPDAELWIEGAKTMQTGDVREFISPPIQPGRPYTYEVKVKWMDNGQERTQTRTLKVEPGRLVRVDLSRPTEESQ
jgi:uncharacterized protein (TIGR03000 family)